MFSNRIFNGRKDGVISTAGVLVVVTDYRVRYITIFSGAPFMSDDIFETLKGKGFFISTSSTIPLKKAGFLITKLTASIPPIE